MMSQNCLEIICQMKKRRVLYKEEYKVILNTLNLVINGFCLRFRVNFSLETLSFYYNSISL